MVQVLEAKTNPFGGMVTDPQALPDDPEHFGRRLRCSLDSWRAEGVQVVWLEIPISKASLIPVAVDLGFVYHHSGEGYLLLTCALVENPTSRLSLPTTWGPAAWCLTRIMNCSWCVKGTASADARPR